MEFLKASNNLPHIATAKDFSANILESWTPVEQLEIIQEIIQDVKVRVSERIAVETNKLEILQKVNEQLSKLSI